jgi:hypothetical protein
VVEAVVENRNIIFQILPGTPGWSLEMFEPLTIGLIFPFPLHRPWQLRGTPKMFHLARQVQNVQRTDLGLKGLFCANYY